MEFENSKFHDSKPTEDHNRNYQGKGHRHKKDKSFGHRMKYNSREFIAFDGEGLQVNEPKRAGWFHSMDVWTYDEQTVIFDYKPEPQPYVLLANSKGQRITNPNGITTWVALDFLLDTKEEFPESIFVGYGFNYDVNQILKDIPWHLLAILHKTNKLHWGGYYLEWYPRKWFYVKHGMSGRSCILYDVFGFFQQAFLGAAAEYLGEDDEGLALIQQGKQARAAFKWEELEFVIRYNNMELDMLVRMMNILREDLHQVGIHPAKWHGPGAIANQLFNDKEIPIPTDMPEEVLDACQYAYFGGRFEQFDLGCHKDTVWEADIRSAYPAGAIGLPDLTSGYWEHVKEFEPGTFGVWSVSYQSRHGNKDARPQPLPCRAENGSVSFPSRVSGWYWTPEASLVSDYIREGYVFRPESSRKPFGFIGGLYERRRSTKKVGLKRVLKLIINSIYGKLAQTIGASYGPPRWHCMAYAGWITSYTRAKLYRAVMQKPGRVIAVETDAVFSTEPLDLPYSDELGEWELIELAEITYLQSGFYYAKRKDGTIICRYRGMDKDSDTGFPIGLPYERVQSHLQSCIGAAGWPTPPLITMTTRFVGLGLALTQESVVWRSWETTERFISLDGNPKMNKRYHTSDDCAVCDVGWSLATNLHPMLIGGYSGPSYARALPWRTVSLEAPASPEEVSEMTSEVLEYEHTIEAWQD